MDHFVRRYFIAALQLIVFGNGFIALCCVVMCLTTGRLFNRQLPDSLLAFLFVGTLGSYSLHEYLTDEPTGCSDRRHWIAQHKQLLLGLFMSSVLIGTSLLTQLTSYLSDLIPVVVLTFLYTAPKINWEPFLALRRIAILKTTYLALVWTYVTVGLPLRIGPPAVAINWAMAGAWFLNRFLLIYSLALCFDYRDRAVDRQSKWLTIVSMLTERQIRIFFGLIGSCFCLTAVTLYRLGWDEWTLLSVCLPMLVLLLVGRRIVRSSSDYGYYLGLDSLLMLSGLLLSLAG